MFQFRRFPTYAYFVQRTLTEYCSAGFPHSEIPGSKPMCGSPRLIAACHVLHRLSMPRHSPCALISLTVTQIFQICNWFSSRIMQASDSVHCSFVLPFKKSTKVYFVTSLLLARNFLLAFTVQFSRCRPLILFKTRLKCSDACPNTSIYSWWRLPDSNR